MAKQIKKITLFQKIKVLINIILLLGFTYCAIIFISHFSVNHQVEGYSYLDSLGAIYSQTSIAKEFVIYFGLLGLAIIIVAVLINKVATLLKRK